MSLINFIPASLRALPRDGIVLFLTRFLRLFAYGALSVVLVFYLVSLGLTETQVGLLLTLTLAGDIAISLLLTTRADQIGRRRTLIAGAILMAGAGVAFASTHNLLFLIIAGTIGVISPSGNEVGPFLSIEQAALSHVVSAENRTEVFAWYTLAGSVATALGALCGGAASGIVQKASFSASDSYRAVVLLYAALGMALAFLFLSLSSSTEVRDSVPEEGSAARKLLGVGHSRSIVFKLSSLFALDSFAGGFVVQSFAAYWFYLRFGVQPVKLGVIFFWANVLAGISALLASRLASRIGLVKDDGSDAPTFECSTHPCAVDAQPRARRGGAAHPLQHQPDGRSDKTVRHHGGGSPRGTFRRRRNYRRGEDGGSGHESHFRGVSVLAPASDRHPFLHRRGAQDRLRPDSISTVCGDPAAGGSSLIRGLFPRWKNYGKGINCDQSNY